MYSKWGPLSVRAVAAPPLERACPLQFTTISTQLPPSILSFYKYEGDPQYPEMYL